MKSKLKLYYFIIGIMIALFVSTCACFCVIATGYVDTKRLIIYSGTAEKAYDGTPLTSSMYGIKNGNLKEGHTLVATPYGEQTEVGVGLNHFHYMIVDEYGNSVESQYRVICAPGILLVHEPGWIDWEKLESAKNYLDKYGEFDFESSGLDFDKESLEDLLGEDAFPDISGEMSNDALEKLLGALGMLMNQGKLPPELDGSGGASGEGEGSTGGGANGSGVNEFDNNLKKESNGLGDTPEREVLRFYAPSDKTYYLRYESFGDYNGSGWEIAPENTDSAVSPLYYTGLSLASNYPSETVKVEILDDSGMYFLPYYSLTGITSEKSDVKFKYKSNTYSASIISTYDYLNWEVLPTMETKLAKEESKYREYVYDNYLTIDSELKNLLINLTNFQVRGVSLVNLIKNYVQNSATYNINFASFPNNVDMVSYFLTGGKEGICQHFAAAGTMMFRAYGIPARYTCGYMVNAVSEDWTTVTDKYAHAWVEIYVDGFGWVPVEVTGGGYSEARKNTLKIGTVSKEKIYDGLEFSEDAFAWEVISGTLYEGHQIVPVFNGDMPESPISAGETENTGYDYKIVDEFGSDVTNQYIIDAETRGTLSITKRPLTVVAGTGKVEYTGEELNYPFYEYQSGLLDGHNIIVVSGSTATDIGFYENNISVKIESEWFEDLTDQYEITVAPGEMQITKITLHVYTNSESHTYNDNYAFYTGYEIYNSDKIVSGHTHAYLEDSYVNYIREVGETAENVFEIAIYDGETDVTDTYYTIEYYYGQLEVIPINIEIRTNSGESVYDGNEFSVPQKEVYGALYRNDYIKEISYSKAIEVGTYENQLIYDIVEFIDGEEVSVLSRYDVSEVWGELKVFASEIIITTATRVKTYDGAPLSDTNYTLEGVLASNHEIRLKGEAVSITEPGFVSNTNEFGVFIKGTDQEILDAYKVTHRHGYLSVEYIHLYIENGSATKTYDGEPLTCLDKEIVSGALLDGHELELIGEPKSITEVGYVYNNNEYRIIEHVLVDGETITEDVTHYYDIMYVSSNARLVINPIYVTIKNGGASKTYDGEPLSCLDKAITSGALLGGHELELIGEPISIIEVGYTYNSNKYRIVSKEIIDGETIISDVTSHYVIEYEKDANTRLVINPINVTIKNGGASKTYDGEPLSCTDKEIISGALLDGHELQLIGEPKTILYATNVYNDNQYRIIETKVVDGETVVSDVTSHYAIEYQRDADTYLVINPITIMIKTNSAEKYYDGTPLTCFDYTLEGELLAGHEEERTKSVLVSEIGLLRSNTNEYTIYGNVDTGNGVEKVDLSDSCGKYYVYNIQYVYGTLQIKPIVIRYYTNSASKVYDGLPLFDKTINKTIKSNDGKLLSGHAIKIEDYSSIIEIGSTENNVTITIVHEDTQAVVENYQLYYHIEITSTGTLTILETGSEEPDTPGGNTPGETPGDTPGGNTPGDKPDKPDEPQIGDSTILAQNSNDIRDNFNKVIFVLYASQGGELYLREYSYGDYNGKGFDGAVIYESDISPLFYLGSYLSALGVEGQSITINSSAGYKVNVLPYYSTDGTAIGDVSVKFSSGYYNVTAYAMNYFSGVNIELTGDLADMEALYREFVYDNYLNVDQELSDILMNKFTNPYNLTGSELVKYLAEQVQNYATYNLDFKYQSGANPITEFLRLKEGICQHYAATATMLYRSYGIPARFVGGYKVDAQAGVLTEVKGMNAHAWVEVYVDGVGWIPVEVTGTTSEQEKDTMSKMVIMVGSADGQWTYDGEKHYNSNVILLDGMLQDKHKIVLTDYTTIIDVGTKD